MFTYAIFCLWKFEFFFFYTLFTVRLIIYIQQIILYLTKDLTPNRLENKICNAILQIFKS